MSTATENPGPIDVTSTGLHFKRVFSSEDVNPYDQIRWERRTAEIPGKSGVPVFLQHDVEVPESWSQTATAIVFDKYAYGRLGTPERESSVRQIVGRVVDTIAQFGYVRGYFADHTDLCAFADELAWLLLNQHASFNSPVWFNVGCRPGTGWSWDLDADNGAVVRNGGDPRYQTSACLPYSSLINTTRGLIPIGDIVLGLKNGFDHSAFDEDGKPTRIVAGVCNGKRRSIKLELEDGSFLRMTPDHVVFVRKTNGDVIEKSAGDLDVGDRMVLSRKELLSHEPELRIGQVRVSRDVAWMAGAMVGNGFSGRPPSATSDTWEIKVNTEAERDTCTSFLDSAGIPYTVTGFHWGFAVRGYGSAGKSFWSALGLWNHTGAKVIPGWVLTAGWGIVAGFLDGIFSTDGCVTDAQNGRVTIGFSNVSEDVARKVHVLLRSLGIYATLGGFQDEREDASRQYCWTVAIHDEHSVDRFAWLIGFTNTTKSLRLASRREPAPHDYRTRTEDVAVRAKSSAGAELVYDIQTESGTFWYEGVLVHNCFILGMEDTIESIAATGTAEMRIFKDGSGAGGDRSPLRSSREPITGGGKASGPVSFMAIYDAIGSVTKSGGRTRRAARMDTLKCWHPDILEFIRCKRLEEAKALALIAAGYEGDFNGEAYQSVKFQNCNMSVRATDAFLKAVEEDADWQTLTVVTGNPEAVDGTRMPNYPAGSLMDEIALGTWTCGDPGIQYEDTIQRWHTTPNAGPINSSNPCSEYMSLDDSACNLASLNLMKFRRDDGPFDVERFRAACRILAVAMDILVDLGSYPTPEIARNAHRFRQLGLGYTNLGSLILANGLPYDSDEGRSLAGAIAAIMTGQVYLTSAEMAEKLGPFDGFAADRENMLRVMGMHRDSAYNLCRDWDIPSRLVADVCEVWDDAFDAGRAYGYRNAQGTVLAPTGTISFMMDCYTTGIEPAIALVSYKNLWGRGQLKLVNETVGQALGVLDYTRIETAAILKHIEDHDTIEGAPDLKIVNLPVFDCAFPPAKGTRSIHWRGHLKMVAAVQPFLSGAVSKCVTGDTVLATNEGLIRIGSLYANEAPDTFRPISLRVPNPTNPTNSETSSVLASDFYYGGVKPVWKVTLSDGRSIRATDQHRLRVVADHGDGLDWEYIPNLQPGTFVAIFRGTELWGNSAPPRVDLSPLYGCQNAITIPKESSFDLGLFLGMLTADGHIVETNYVVGITKNSDEVLSTFLSLLRKLFGLDGRSIADKRNGVQGVVVGSKGLTEWLGGIGFSKEHVPDFLLRSSRQTLLGYLSGLYLDGYIGGRRDVAISQKHRSLLIDIQAIWDNLGIPTYFSSNVVNGMDYPVLHIQSSHRKTASDLIRWLEPHKAKAASDLVNGKDRRPFPLYRAKLAEMIRSQSRTAEFRNVLDPRSGQITRETFFDAAQEVGLTITDEEKGLDYLQVVSVEHAGEEPVYDLAVPLTHAFVGNGIVNHNTINMPRDSTVADIRAAYLEGWKLGLKAVAIYRDGSKGSQPVSTSKAPSAGENGDDSGGVVRDGVRGPLDDSRHRRGDPSPGVTGPRRERLPDTRASVTHKLSVGSVEAYLTVGHYPDGRPGEVFVEVAKQGSTVGGLMDAWATMVSIALQYGVPPEVIAEKFRGGRFEPSGITHNADIPFAASLIDYIARWIGMEYVPGYREANAPRREDDRADSDGRPADVARGDFPVMVAHAPVCVSCGGLCQPAGACWVCRQCGQTTGGCG